MGMIIEVNTLEEMCDLMCDNKLPRRQLMKNTKYLFKDDQAPVGMVSVSQLQTFMSCKKKWAYNYLENLKPRVDRTYLTIGKLCHKGMQIAMQELWEDQQAGSDDVDGRWEEWRYAGLSAIEDEWEEYMQVTSFLDEEIPDMEQTLEDAKSIFKQAFEEFKPWKYEVLTLYKDKKPIPALELHFAVPCPPSKGLHGYIDAILKDKETGFTWCTDYKFRKTLSPDDDESFNIQNAVYTYACDKMGIEITGTMTWQHINTPAADPAILKDGSISKSRIKTTWDHYKKFCEDHGQDPACYTEMIEKLADIEWFRSTYEYRNEKTIKNMWNECIIPATKGIRSAYGARPNLYRSIYPWNCKMCQYQSLCQAELRDYDADAIRDREYVRR